MDTEFVLDTAHVHSAVPLVIDEHGKSSSIFRAFLGAGEYEVQVCITVGDEPFHPVEPPASGCLIVCCLEHYALQV